MSKTPTAAEMANIDSLVLAAAAEGKRVFQHMEHIAEQHRLAKERLNLAKGEAQKLAEEAADPGKDGAAGDFATPRLNGLVEVARIYDATFLPPKNNTGAPRVPFRGANIAATNAADAFAKNSTKATDKTAKGGTNASFVTIIEAGTVASRVQSELQVRVDHWKSLAKIPKAKDESPADYKRRVADAEKYAVVAGSAHNGRPAKTMPNGIVLEGGKGTNRTAQFAAAIRLYAQWGDNFLVPEVLDAFLDNGGRKETTKTAADLAQEAQDLLMVLRDNHDGGLSPDGVILSMAISVLRNMVANKAWSQAGVVREEQDRPTEIQVESAPVSAPNPAPTAPNPAPEPPPAAPVSGTDPTIDALANALLGTSVDGLLAPVKTPAPDEEVVPPPAAAKPSRKGRGNGSMAGASAG